MAVPLGRLVIWLVNMGVAGRLVVWLVDMIMCSPHSFCFFSALLSILETSGHSLSKNAFNFLGQVLSNFNDCTFDFRVCWAGT